MPDSMSGSDPRLRRLVEAVVLVGSDLSLPAVLGRLVEAACELAGARYGALGVVGTDGGLEQFIPVGFDEDTIAAIGPFPKGRGILGLLIAEPKPLRLADLTRHVDSYGFPPHHPPMRSFLGVPIRVRGEVFGNLYLTEKQGADAFSAEDEELVVALATAAGVSIENARLYDATRQRERGLESIREVTQRLLGGADRNDVLELVARRALELVEADTATIAVPCSDTELVLEVAVGAHAGKLRGSQFPIAGSVSGRVIETGRSLVLDDAANDERVYQPIVRLGRMGPALLVPLSARGAGFGTLAVANTRGGSRFDERQQRLVEGLAAHAAVALEYAAAQAEVRRLLVVEDRERIARDLHDTVIQRLFATGMALQGAARLTDRPEIAERIQRAVDDLDDTIRDIRSSIFVLQPPERRGRGLRVDVLALVGEAGGNLGFEPHVAFDGPVDASVSEEISEHLLATLREALSNVARHARATRADVMVEVVNGELLLEVDDDGRGVPAPVAETGVGAGQGLRNLGERAGTLGGSLKIAGRPGGGTALRWRVPLPASEEV